MTNQTGEVWITSDDDSKILMKEGLYWLYALPEQSFYKVSFKLGSTGGDVDYDLSYCEAEGKACKDTYNSSLLSIGVGASCLILLLVALVISYLCYRCKHHQAAQKKPAVATPPENVQSIEFEPYDELDLSGSNGKKQDHTGLFFYPSGVRFLYLSYIFADPNIFSKALFSTGQQYLRLRSTEK